MRQLSRNNFYLDDILFLTIVLPVRGVAQLCRFLDWFLIDGLLMGVPSQITSEIANAAKPLRNGFVQFYATSVVIAVAVLAVVLTWLGNTG